MEVEFIQACPTTTLLIMSTVMSAVGTAAQYAGQRETAKKKETYQRHLAELQKNAAHRKSAALISKNIQTGEAVARKKHEVSKAGAKASAQGRLSAISGGVAGLSIETLLTEYESQEGYEGRMLQGKAARATDAFRSQAEVVAAMNDPRYDKDEAYRRDVYDKLERSNVAF